MRSCLLALSLLFAPQLSAPQQPPAGPAIAAQQHALTSALLGKWIGVLEYRDYSEPAGSPKRVQLPTWLTISPAPEGISFDYIYDDGPGKTVTEHNVLVLNLAQASYRVVSTDAVAEQYTLAGAENLKDGHGVLTLTGPGKDADKPAEFRITWTIRRNLLSWLQEVRPSGSAAPFVFRHRYVFTRANAPSADK